MAICGCSLSKPQEGEATAIPQGMGVKSTFKRYGHVVGRTMRSGVQCATIRDL